MVPSPLADARGAPPAPEGYILNWWQERHAELALRISKTVGDFRYVLCPRRMKDEKFWRIYFTLADPHLRAAYTKAMAEDAEETRRASEERERGEEERVSSIELAPRLAAAAEGGDGEAARAEDAGERAADEDEDLESYLMGVLKSTEASSEAAGGGGGGDAGAGGEDAAADDIDDFSAEDFDQLISEDFESVLELKSEHASDDGDAA